MTACSSVPSLSFGEARSSTSHSERPLQKESLNILLILLMFLLGGLEGFCLFPFCDKMNLVEFIQLSLFMSPLVVNIPTSVKGKFLQGVLWVFTLLVLYIRFILDMETRV